MNNALATVIPVFINTVLPIFLVIGAGYLAQKRLRLNLSTIARMGLYILSPCLGFSSLIHSRLSGGDAFGVVTVMLCVTGLLWAVGSLTARALGQSEGAGSALLLATLFTNAGNYGIPLLDLAFGRASRDLAVIAFVTQQILFNTLAVWLATRGQLGWKRGLWQVGRMPVIWAVAAAVFFMASGVPVPYPVDKATGLLGEAALPVILLSLGIQLAETAPAFKDAPRIAVGVVYRLALSPALTVAALAVLAPLFQMGPLAVRVALVAMSMPTAVTVVLLSIEFGADSKFVAGVVFFSTLMSAFTLTIILTLLL